MFKEKKKTKKKKKKREGMFKQGWGSKNKKKVGGGMVLKTCSACGGPLGGATSEFGTTGGEKGKQGMKYGKRMVKKTRGNSIGTGWDI